MSIKNRTLLLLILLIFIRVQSSDAFLKWFFGSNEEPTEEKSNDGVGESLMSELRSKKKMNFDLQTTDSKFISEMTAKEMGELSALDGCHHQVMSKLRKTCSHLNEEQVSKIAVQLLNCQLESEQRPTFVCNDDMTLAECTKHMDPTLWNSYQIVSNRARAICYTIRQQQFRWKSEMAVNQLMQSTSDQLNAMKDLKEGQESVAEATSGVLRKMYEGQQDLMINHQTLKNSHDDIHQYVADNLKELTKEKALIATGNKEIAELIDQIRKKMDDATHQLLEQHQDTQQNHEEVLKDLSEIRRKAREVWEKIDKSSKHVLHFQNETTEQYKRTLNNLEKVNNTISYVLTSVNNMQSGINSKLQWVTEMLGGTDDKLALLSVGAVHLIYFILAAISASFLQTPWFTRLVMMIIVPLNALSEMKQGVSLDFSAMTVFIFFTCAANWFMNYLTKVTRPRLMSIQKGTSSPPLSPFRCPHTSPTSPVITPAVQQAEPKHGLTDSDLRKLANTLKVYMKSSRSRASSTCTSTPLNLSLISMDSAIGTPLNQFDDTDTSKLDITQDCTMPKIDEISMETTVNTTKASSGSETETDSSELPTPAKTENDAPKNVVERADITEIKPDLDTVRRQLMQSLDQANQLRRSRRSLTATPSKNSRCATPTRGSRSSTPVKGTPSRSQTPVKDTSRVPSRPGTPSSVRPTCNALTNAGQPCKNKCMVGDVFCYVHVTKIMSDSKSMLNTSRTKLTFSSLNTTSKFDESEINVTR